MTDENRISGQIKISGLRMVLQTMSSAFFFLPTALYSVLLLSIIAQLPTHDTPTHHKLSKSFIFHYPTVHIFTPRSANAK
jgi:hypothetical protein